MTENYLPHVLADDGVTPQLHGTVYQMFCASCDRWPDQEFLSVASKTAQVYNIDAQAITYAQARETIDVLRDAYRQAGYGHGHRAGLLLENRPSFFYHWFALNALGVSVVPINADFQAAELDYLIDHSEICLVVALASHHSRLADSAARLGQNLVIISGDESSISAAPVQAPNDQTPELLSECALLYTSGTTGRPKGCVLPNEYFLYAAFWYRELGGMCELKMAAERLISPLPLVHMNAMAVSSMAMVLCGGTIILVDRFHPRDWWSTVRETRATIVHYLGVMPAMLMGAPKSADDKDHQVRFGFGAGVDRRLQQPFEDRFGFPLVEGWAMTETGGGGCIMANVEPRKVGSNCFGRPPAGVAVQVLDDEGKPVAPEQPGELLVRWSGTDPSFGFFKRYLKNSEATAQAWADGWFHTGDIVRTDADGDLHFIDRKKNVIRRSGENISAVEVEGVLMQHAQVASVGIAPVPDAIRGDEVFACIVTPDGTPENEATARDIVTHSLQSLSYFKAPGYVIFVDSLPLTATQKVQRGELKNLVNRLLEDPACFDLRGMKKRHG